MPAGVEGEGAQATEAAGRGLGVVVPLRIGPCPNPATIGSILMSGCNTPALIPGWSAVGPDARIGVHGIVIRFRESVEPVPANLYHNDVDRPLILLVDDFEDALEMYSTYLTFKGHRVTTAR